MPATGREISEKQSKRARPGASAGEVAGYIGAMTREMERLAYGAGLKDLAGLLREAREEAGRRMGE